MLDNFIPQIRNAARALIVRDGQILLLRKEGGERGERFALPGGAQNLGETLEQALNRECQEEIGTEVCIHDLLHVADYFKQRETVPPSTRHLVEFLFRCSVPDGYLPKNGYRPDKHQIEVVWARLEKIGEMNLFPQSLAAYIKNSDGRVYLGKID